MNSFSFFLLTALLVSNSAIAHTFRDSDTIADIEEYQFKHPKKCEYLSIKVSDYGYFNYREFENSEEILGSYVVQFKPDHPILREGGKRANRPPAGPWSHLFRIEKSTEKFTGYIYSIGYDFNLMTVDFSFKIFNDRFADTLYFRIPVREIRRGVEGTITVGQIKNEYSGRIKSIRCYSGQKPHRN